MSCTTGDVLARRLPGRDGLRLVPPRPPDMRPGWCGGADAVVLPLQRSPRAPQAEQAVPVAALNPESLDLPCELNDGDMWFAESPAELERAKALCVDCPVRTACLAGALERREPAGVWGGEIFDNGRILPRKRPRGRPRKDRAA